MTLTLTLEDTKIGGLVFLVPDSILATVLILEHGISVVGNDAVTVVTVKVFNSAVKFQFILWF